mmetsp:Transcript_101756/g.314037  ORF Transcript_101756/g.314037 Transcript_101756/m.314037 type:complete len:473 (+) Transcript_101756:39-1457(+)
MALAVPYAACPTGCGLSPSRAIMGRDAQRLSSTRPVLATGAPDIITSNLDAETANGRPLALASLLGPRDAYAPSPTRSRAPGLPEPQAQSPTRSRAPGLPEPQAPEWLPPQVLRPPTPSRAPEVHLLALEALATAKRGRQYDTPSREDTRRVLKLAQVFSDMAMPQRHSMKEGGLTEGTAQEKPVLALSAMTQEPSVPPGIARPQEMGLLHAAVECAGEGPRLGGGSTRGCNPTAFSNDEINTERYWASSARRFGPPPGICTSHPLLATQSLPGSPTRRHPSATEWQLPLMVNTSKSCSPRKQRISSISSLSTWAYSSQSQGSEPGSPMSPPPQRSTMSSTCSAHEQLLGLNEELEEGEEDEEEQNSGLDAGGLKKLERLVWLQMKCSQAPEAPAVPTEALSCGTVGHPDNCAIPCKFFATRRGCKDGMACSHCHACQWRSCLRRTHGRSPRRERRSAERFPAKEEAAALQQ